MNDQVVEQIDGIRLSLSALSREFGISRDTVRKRLGAAGVRPDGKRQGYDVFRLGSAVRALLEAELAAPERIDNPEALPPMERRAWYQSERERIALLKDQQLLVPAEDVRQEIALVVKLTGQFLDTLPDLLERDFHLPPEAARRLQQRLDLLRDDWAQQLETE